MHALLEESNLKDMRLRKPSLPLAAPPHARACLELAARMGTILFLIKSGAPVQFISKEEINLR